MSELSSDLIPNLIKSRNRGGRCTYEKEAKRELVRRCLQPGVSLARTAMEHGVNANLVRKWVRQETAERAPRERAVRGMITTTPLLTVRTETMSASPERHAPGYLEMIVAGGTIRIFGPVDATALTVALSCLARHP